MINLEILTYVLYAVTVVCIVLFVMADIHEQRASKEARIAAKRLAEIEKRLAYEEGYWDGRGY